jgi:UDP-N-acetylmuramoylalanine--D-glutamate ligase
MILGTENPYLEEVKDHPVQRIYFTKGQLAPEFKEAFDFSRARVKGEHNEANFFAAYEVLRLLEIPDLENLFQEFVNEFPGVAHRLEFVLEKDGLTLYNDAKSTNSLATTTAIRAFSQSQEPLYLILGGKLRNEADKLLPDLLPYQGRISKIFTIGDVTDRLYEELKDHFEVDRAGDLKTVFKKSFGLRGNLVFSPAFPSFDQFKNYVDRGEKFKEWAREVFCK